MTRTVTFEIEVQPKRNGDWVLQSRMHGVTNVRAARKRFAEFLKQWTPEGKTRFRIARRVETHEVIE